MGPEETVPGVAVLHIEQGKLKGGLGHLFALHHDLTGVLHNGAHVQAVGADGGALAAEAAGVDHGVGMAGTHGDREVVIDLPDIFSGIGFEVLQKGAGMDALQALAVDAARGLLHSLLSVKRRQGPGAALLIARNIGVQCCGIAPFGLPSAQ